MTRKTIEFLKSRNGQLLGFFLIAGIAVLLYSRYQPDPKAGGKATSFNDTQEYSRGFREIGDFGWGGDDENSRKNSRFGADGRRGKGRNDDGDEWDDWDDLLGDDGRGGTGDDSNDGSGLNRNHFKALGNRKSSGKGGPGSNGDGTGKNGDGRNGSGTDGKSADELERDAARRRRELLKKLRQMKMDMAMKSSENDGAGGDGGGGNGSGDGGDGNNGKGLHVSEVVLYESGAEAEYEALAKGGLSDTYAPYGRLITCQMVNTVDSANMLTPIVALVMEDVWHNGKVVIPAGTEVHGKAVSMTTRDRVATETGWVFVWRTKTPDNGKEMAVQALALDYTKDVKTGRYAMTDGSAGLRGFQMQTAEYAKLKLYLAQFVQGSGSGLTELLLRRATTSGGSTYVDSDVQGTEGEDNDDEEKVALAAGAQQVADQMVTNLIDELSRNGSFVRVPAGTTFYLYVMQTLDKKFARPGATIGIGVKDAEPKEDPLVKQQMEANELMRQAVQERLESRQNRKNIQDSIRK